MAVDLGEHRLTQEMRRRRDGLHVRRDNDREPEIGERLLGSAATTVGIRALVPPPDSVDLGRRESRDVRPQRFRVVRCHSTKVRMCEPPR